MIKIYVNPSIVSLSPAHPKEGQWELYGQFPYYEWVMGPDGLGCHLITVDRVIGYIKI